MNVKIIDSSFKPLETLYIAFRTCYSKDVPTEIKIPTIETSIGNVIDKEKIAKFIKDKIDKGHDSPLEHVSFTFAIEGVSRITEQQLTRHRIGVAYSIQSGRYTNRENSSVIIPDSWLKVSSKEECEDLIDTFKNTYKKLIDLGVPKEDARYLLPNGTATNIIMTVNLRSLRHIYAERSCKYAQEEIRMLVNKMMKLTKAIIPFADYKAKKCGISCFECKEGK